MVELVLHRVRPIAQKRDIELTMISVRDVYAEIDEVKMNMVITNLVENAVKYNRDHGKVRVTINADPYNFYISVEDTGVGIPEDSLDKIYERFYRVDKSRSKEVGGTGLGLSITKSIVLQHHGAIDVKSILGEGTIFRVTCPLTYVSHPVELRRQKERMRQYSSRRRKKASSSAAVRTAPGTANPQPGSAAASAGKKKASLTGAQASGRKKKASPSGAQTSGQKKKASPSGAQAAGQKKKTSPSGAQASGMKKTSSSGTQAAGQKRKTSPSGAQAAGMKKKASAPGAQPPVRNTKEPQRIAQG